MTSAKVDSTKKQNDFAPLLQAPLLEAIFEMRWELQSDGKTGRMRDPSYPVMYGRLYDRFKKEFPKLEDLSANNTHPEAAPYALRHRMRQEKGYPLMQIGPGIITVNLAKDYSWTTLKTTILRLVTAIGELFPVETFPLNWIKAELRYVNAIRFDSQKESALDFLRDKLHIHFGLEDDFFALTGAASEPLATNFHLVYPLKDPVANLILAGALGEMEGKTAYIIQTVVDSLGETAPHDRFACEGWLEKAHHVSRESFKSLCKGPLMERFRGA